MTCQAREGLIYSDIGSAGEQVAVSKPCDDRLVTSAELSGLDRDTDVRPDITFTQLLDAMPDAAAVLDSTGTIIAVNRMWRAFTQDNEGSVAQTGVGTSYLQVCTRSAARGCVDAAEALAGIRAVLLGDTLESVSEYACSSSTVDRWFALRVTRIDGWHRYVLISHTNITRQKLAQLDLERKASHDPLTGLANRARLHKRLMSALTLRTGRPSRGDVGILYLDLDRFKPVNDTYGHAAGDEVLQTVAARLRDLVRPQDTVARVGGDEFCVVITRTTGEQLAAMAGRVHQALAQPYRVHGDLITVGASVGACMAVPGEDPEEALHRADLAMYAAKRRGHARG